MDLESNGGRFEAKNRIKACSRKSRNSQQKRSITMLSPFQIIPLVIVAYASDYDCPSTQMNPEYREAILKSHNGYRSTVAKGTAQMPEGKLAKRARNMYRFDYDCDLERTAQHWANTCKYEHSPSGWRNAGENLWVKYADYPLTISKQTMTDAAYHWWNELAEYGIIDSSYIYSRVMSPIGHWTQMAWGNTLRIGCGVANCHWIIRGWPYGTYVVCHYSPPGNYRGEQIYEFGNGCSQDSDCTLFNRSKCDTQSSLCIKPAETISRPEAVPQPPKPNRTPAPRPDTNPAPNPGPNPRPEETCQSPVMTPAVRRYVLHFHNSIRSDLANGKVVSGVKGRNIYKLRYDCKLEAEAQAWVDMCDIHARPAGNVYFHAGSDRPKNVGDAFKAALEFWRKGFSKYGLSDNTFTNSTPNDLLTFVQMVWGSTTKVGCGVAFNCIVYYDGQQYTTVILACHYSERGNVLGRQIYEVGEPCQRNDDCTTHARSKCINYRGICMAP